MRERQEATREDIVYSGSGGSRWYLIQQSPSLMAHFPSPTWHAFTFPWNNFTLLWPREPGNVIPAFPPPWRAHSPGLAHQWLLCPGSRTCQENVAQGLFLQVVTSRFFFFLLNLNLQLWTGSTMLWERNKHKELRGSLGDGETIVWWQRLTLAWASSSYQLALPLLFHLISCNM